MDSTDSQVAELVAAFEKKRDPARMHEALELIEAAERSVSTDDTAARKHVVSRWLKFFAVLDRNIDPAWNIDKKPAHGVAPPSSHSGTVYPSGEVDPVSILDPVERAEYVRALKANRDYRKGYDTQFQLRCIDDRATAFFVLFVVERYTDLPADWRELEDLLTASQIGEVRKKRLISNFKKTVFGTPYHQ